MTNDAYRRLRLTVIDNFADYILIEQNVINVEIDSFLFLDCNNISHPSFAFHFIYTHKVSKKC